MDDLKLYHPAIQGKSDSWLTLRQSWMRFFMPRDEWVLWWGDARLYARNADYQQLLDAVPPKATVGEGMERTTDPNIVTGPELDRWRRKVDKYLGRTME